MDGIVEGLDALLTLLENILDSDVFGSALPFVGDKFKEQFESLSERARTSWTTCAKSIPSLRTWRSVRPQNCGSERAGPR